jgi:thiamine-phosphate pyrophosphorylase
MAQAEQAIAEGADYIGVGPIFSTTTKEKPDEVVGTELIADVAAVSPVPVVAIGGITLENVSRVIQAGGRCVAVISDILTADRIEERTRKFKAVLTGGLCNY